MGKDSYALATGLFVATLAAGIVIIIIWMGNVQPHTQIYIAETRDSVTGLKPGSTVYYRGIAVGKVSTIKFDPANPAVIIVQLEVDDKVSFTHGVYATLDLKGVTGLTQIALKDNGDNPELLLNGSHPDNRIPINPSLINRLSVSGENTVREAHKLIVSLNLLLNDENIHYVRQILNNVESATARFNSLQDSAENALNQIPSLTKDARRTLVKINDLAGEFKQLSQQVRQQLVSLTKQSAELMQTGTHVENQLLQTTLPRVNGLMLQMQVTARRFGRVATILETDPQMFLLGTKLLQPAPGEPGFME